MYVDRQRFVAMLANSAYSDFQSKAMAEGVVTALVDQAETGALFREHPSSEEDTCD